MIIKEVINKKKHENVNTKFNIDGSAVSDCNIVANKFNEYFVNTGSSLADKISLTNDNPINLYLKDVTVNEVSVIIASLKNSSPGYDDICAKVIKSSFEFFIEPLTYIFNLSLTQGVFPTELKTARVTPIFKSLDRAQINNYRSVSVLPIFSKFWNVLCIIVLFLLQKRRNYYMIFNLVSARSTAPIWHKWFLLIRLHLKLIMVTWCWGSSWT